MSKNITKKGTNGTNMKGLMAPATNNVRCTCARKETERKIENHVERLVQKRLGKCGVNEEDVLNRIKWKRDIQNHFGATPLISFNRVNKTTET